MIAAAGTISLWDSYRSGQIDISAKVPIALVLLLVFTLSLGTIPGAIRLAKAFFIGPVFVDGRTYLGLCGASLLLLSIFYFLNNSVVRSVCLSIFLLIPFAMETLSSSPQPRVVDPMCIDAP